VGLLCLLGTVADLILTYLEKRDKHQCVHLQGNGEANYGEANERTGLLSNTTESYTPHLIVPPRRGKLLF